MKQLKSREELSSLWEIWPFASLPQGLPPELKRLARDVMESLIRDIQDPAGTYFADQRPLLAWSE